MPQCAASRGLVIKIEIWIKQAPNTICAKRRPCSTVATHMDIRSLLEANNSKLLQVYKENYSATIALQQTLLEAVLPHIEDELQLDSNAVQWAKERLEDTSE